VVLAAALLVAAPAGSAQEKAAAEGIKVHGHWTIDVKNPDGSLASHHEFENALVQSGQNALSSVLAHNVAVVGWAVFLQDGSGIWRMMIEEPQSGYPVAGPVSANLTVNTSNPQQVVLQGSVPAPGALSIANVQTVLVTQDPSVNASTDNPFSQRALPQPIAVEYNQIVQVTVVFSFS
jgi:hypothetical protein